MISCDKVWSKQNKVAFFNILVQMRYWLSKTENGFKILKNVLNINVFCFLAFFLLSIGGFET